MFAFDIDFGASPHAPDPMDLLQFWRMLHKPGPNVQSQNQNDAQPLLSFLSFDSNTNDTQGPVPSTADGAALKFALEDGGYPISQSSSSNGSDPSSTGAGTKWFVKGGTFKFRINTDFAVSQATVVGNDASTDVTEHTITVDPLNGGQIFSRPMHVSAPIISQLSITITKLSTSEIVTSWRNPAADMKGMPLAAFGSYDSNLDPANPKADVSTLLDGKNATVNLMMGVLLSSPGPHLDPSPIPTTNASKMQEMGIKDYRTNPNGDDWMIQPFEAAQQTYLPAPLTAAQQSATESGDDEQLWQDMANTWSGLASQDVLVNDPTDGLLAQCAEVFAWRTNRPQAEVVGTTTSDGGSVPGVGSTTTTTTAMGTGTGTGTGTGSGTMTTGGSPSATDGYQPWVLTGSIPKTLIQNLEEAYLDLPRIAVV
jgi:hypothetical protein